ncbi:hypothetical protein CLD22_06815, partial [Rubrivivax gelatinosus]|nr:hypothetical protein [Rubrivivax gelatinosus]
MPAAGSRRPARRSPSLRQRRPCTRRRQAPQRRHPRQNRPRRWSSVPSRRLPNLPLRPRLHGRR